MRKIGSRSGIILASAVIGSLILAACGGGGDSSGSGSGLRLLPPLVRQQVVPERRKREGPSRSLPTPSNCKPSTRR